MIAAFCIGEETQNFFAVSLSHSLCFTGGQGRFLASLEMTIGGRGMTWEKRGFMQTDSHLFLRTFSFL